MAGRIQGITVEIGGDTTKLQTVLKGVNSEIRNTQSQLKDVEADSGGTTEAGTTQRDVVREGVVEIKVSFQVSKIWLQKLSAYKKLSSITVGYLDMSTMTIVNTQMYITGFQSRLAADTSYGSLWEVSFTLMEF